MLRPHLAPRAVTASRVLLVGVLSAGAIAVGLAPPAAADIAQQIRDSQTQLDQVNLRAEKSAERYNAGQISLDKAQRKAAVAQATAARLTTSVAAIRSQAGAFAVGAYRSGTGAEMGLAMLNSTDGPAAFLDRASFLQAIARRNSDVLDQLSTARHRQAQAQTEAAAALADANTVMRGLDADKRAVAQAAGQAQALLGALQAQQAQLIATARDAAARQAAIARAAELARQAALNAAAAASFAAGSSGAGAGGLSSYTGPAAQIALRVAQDQLGKPYVWGASGPNSFDCSGLTMYAYGKAGISLPHYTGDQWNAGRHIAQSQLAPGDLVFFGSDLGHMGMYVGNNTFIHAPHSGDVVKYSTLTGYYADNYAGAVRVAG